MANKADNVTSGKPAVAGAIYRAPLGTTVPTDATTELDAKYKPLGYISEDGLTNSNSPSSTDIKAWGGDIVLTLQTDKPDTFKFKLIEALNADVIKTIYGEDNVTVTNDSGSTGKVKTIAVKANSKEMTDSVYVVEMVLRKGILKRLVIPCGKITALEDINYKDNDVTGYGVTVTATPDADGNTHYEYLSM